MNTEKKVLVIDAEKDPEFHKMKEKQGQSKSENVETIVFLVAISVAVLLGTVWIISAIVEKLS